MKSHIRDTLTLRPLFHFSYTATLKYCLPRHTTVITVNTAPVCVRKCVYFWKPRLSATWPTLWLQLYIVIVAATI